MKRGRFEIKGPDSHGDYTLRAGTGVVVVNAANLEGLAALIHEVLGTPAPQPDVPPEYMAMIERRLSALEKRDATYVERIDRQVDAKHRDLDGRIQLIEQRLTKVEAGLLWTKARVANRNALEPKP